MAFPADRLDVTVELDVDGWTDITSDVLSNRSQITIGRGRMSEGSESAPTTCDMAIRNTTGDYSPRNPTGTHYGTIGRNTQARVYTGTGHLGAAGGASTPGTSHVAPSVTATAAGLMISAWVADDPLNYTIPGSMTAGPSETDGTYSTMVTAYEAVTAGATGTRTATASASHGYVSASAVVHGSSISVEETLSSTNDTLADITLTTDPGTQAGWWLVAVQCWVTATGAPMPDAPYGGDGGWILLADSDVIEGLYAGSTTTYLHARIWGRRVNFAGAQTVIFAGISTTGAADNQAALYVLSGVNDWGIRATVEVPAWPIRWDVTGSDVWVPINGAGILRRLQQGSSPLKSPLRRAIAGASTVQSLLPVAYWPLEDQSGTTRAASGLPGGGTLSATGDIAWATVASPGSAPLPDWSQETGSLTGAINGVMPGDDWCVRLLVQYTGSTDWDVLSVYVTDGLYDEIAVEVSSSGVEVTGIDRSPESSSLTLILVDFGDYSDGEPHWIEVWEYDAGSGDVGHALYIDGSLADSTSTSGTPGVPERLLVRSRSADTAACGHVGVWRAPLAATWSLLIEQAIIGHVGETAGRRVERLCHEEGIACHIVGDPDESAVMGVQSTATLLELLRQCEDADGGILYEPREVLGLAYRTVRSLYNQPVTLALTYGADGEVAPPLEPVDDDRYICNDVTASRSGGSSHQYEVTSGPLSVADPPDGVGRYDHEATLHVSADSRLPSQASWRAHLGTWDEARYPTIRVNLAALGNAGKTALLADAAALDVGDRLTIADPPAWLPPDTIDQHVEGGTETLAQYVWDLRLVCSPAGPYQVGVWETSLYDTGGCELASPYVAGTDTSVAVTTTVGSPWIDGSVSWDWDIGGAQVRVTAISGTTASQTATVNAATVNGVAKSIPAGTPVRLWSPGRYAL
ncbi:hypothetical protein QTQ03_16715 [Micromonospora sp. WMMA1363]|uniref:hypothetical protein n=1 Tax=Micromonospora sp. WMMA1363 TaxID=3053985 RepID=UPI00259CACCB|nr:hypothetical protein [Micromonospora sp. WMMA1363]MDM4721162.1 hypothetical protein [Micromonospora sp. WMMA1363]